MKWTLSGEIAASEGASVGTLVDIAFAVGGLFVGVCDGSVGVRIGGAGVTVGGITVVTSVTIADPPNSVAVIRAVGGTLGEIVVAEDISWQPMIRKARNKNNTIRL
jgi:hypothetical protein